MRLLLITSLVLLSALASAKADIIPTDRRTNWAPGVGTIPFYPQQINVKDAPYNAKGDGTTDDTAAIQAAINACPNGKAVFLPAGTYRTTGQLDILNKSIVVRGAGPTQTKIRLDTGNTANVFKIYTWSTNSTAVAITGGCDLGSTSINVTNATNFAVGDFISISETNASGLVTNQGYGSPATWLGLDNGARCRVQYVQITGKSGNTLTLSRPLYATFSLTNVPQAKEINFNADAGIEDLYMERTTQSGSYSGSNGVYMIFAYHCWLKNIESYKADGAHVKIEQSFACEVRDGYFHEGFANTSGRNYGAFIFGPNSDHLIENNINWKTRHSYIFEGGGSGCVIAYNYSTEGFEGEDPGVLVQDLATHGAHPYMNLHEGNVFTKLSHDNTFGSSSHNTTYRCNMTRKGTTSTVWGFLCVDLETNNQYINVVGCVLGYSGMGGSYEASSGGQSCVFRLGYDSPGAGGSPTDTRPKATIYRHGNFDYITNTTQWDSSNSDRALPASLYLSAKPAFFGATPWPCIGPDLSPMVTKIPAQERFESLTGPGTKPTNAVISIQVSP